MSSTTFEGKTVGFVGLGSMGLAIAEQLVKRFALIVTDLDPSRAVGLVELGAIVADADEIGDRCDVVLACLPGPAEVELALFGPKGVARTLQPGSIVIDMSTSSPVSDHVFALRLAEMNIQYADAPVSGGPHGARAGTLTIMVGASPELYSTIEPLLGAISANVSRVGDLGAGHGMKLAANLLSACLRLATVEAMHMAMSCGVSFDDALAVLNKSGGRSHISDTIYPKFVRSDGYTPQHFSIGLLRKDVNLAVDLGRALDLEMWAASPVSRFLDEAVDRFGETSDINRVMAHWFDEESVSHEASS